MSKPVSLPSKPGDTADPHPTGPSRPVDETATPEASDKSVDWSLYLPIGDDEMPA